MRVNAGRGSADTGLSTVPPTPEQPARGPAGFLSSAAGRRWRNLAGRPWLWPAALTLVITLLKVDGAQLWRDELATWSAVTRTPADLLRLLGNIDAVSGAYYLLMSGWVRLFGDSALALRLPSALAMTAAAALTATLGARLFGARVGVVAGLLFALVPSTSRYGQEARSYAMATLLAVTATLLLYRALAQPRWPRWIGYAAAVVGLGLAHLLAVTLVAAHAVVVALAWQRGDRRPLRWLAACAAAAAMLLPLALVSFGQRTEQLSWIPSPGLAAVAGLPAGVTQAAAVGGLLAGLAAVAAPTTGRRGAGLAACLLLPSALLLVGGLITPLWMPRYLLFTVPFACILAADVLCAQGLRTALLVVSLVAVLGGPAQLTLRRTHDSPRETTDYRAAVAVIATHDRPGDAIVYAARGDDGGMLDAAVGYLARGDGPRDVLAVRDPAVAARLGAEECARPDQCLAGTSRVWLVLPGEWAEPMHGLPPAKAAALRAAFRVERTWSVPGVTVALLDRPS